MAGKVKQRRARKVYTSELAESFANAVNLAAKQVSKEKPDSPSATLDKKECCKACSAKKVALPTSLLHKQKKEHIECSKGKGQCLDYLMRWRTCKCDSRQSGYGP